MKTNLPKWVIAIRKIITSSPPFKVGSHTHLLEMAVNDYEAARQKEWQGKHLLTQALLMMPSTLENREFKNQIREYVGEDGIDILEYIVQSAPH